jgi:hypothetical protein
LKEVGLQLTPLVHERLARCGTSVEVSGLVSGATVEVDVGGAVQTFSAGGADHAVTIAPLDPGDAVTARQDDGSGFTPWSPEVVVEDAAIPPVAAPLLPSQVGGCSQCVRVDGLVPGCEVELRQAGVVVGSRVANRNGWACIGVKLRGADSEIGLLTAEMKVCGATGPDSATAVLVDRGLPAPVVGDPVFGCQRVVQLGQLHLGAMTRIETNTGTFLGWICNCWPSVNASVLHALVPGEQVRAQQFWDGDQCKDEGPFSDWHAVVPPDERIKPEVMPALVEGDRIIRVENQIVGGDIIVVLRDGEGFGLPETRFGPRPASREPEIALNEALIGGQQVAVEQRLCGVVELSDWVTVLPAPPVVLEPIILPPLYACAGAVQVAGLHPGAVVRIFQDGIPCGLAWAGLATNASVAAAPALVVGADVTARQWVGGVAGPESAAVEVLNVDQLHEPRIIEPVAIGDTEVVVSGVTPGSLVSIRTGSTLLGERYASESLVRVGVTPVPAAILPSARLCAETITGGRVSTITSPTAQGPEEGVGELEVDYGTVAIPQVSSPDGSVDGGFDSPLRGRLYYPADSTGKITSSARNRPLVLIAHGYWMSDDLDQSYLGYAWLARHLARWGMFVLSLDLAAVNLMTSAADDGGLQQWSRGVLILDAAERILADEELGGRIDRSRIGLVGHSMSGEGVVAAQVLTQGFQPRVTIRGVVSLAPTNYRPDLVLKNCSYLQLHGSLDYLLRGETYLLGHRLYDRAWRHRTHAWIEGARHHGWNPNWWNSIDGERHAVLPGSLDPDDQGIIGRALINAFFQDTLFSRPAYRGYLQGLVRAHALMPYTVHIQHQSTEATIADDMGDADEALGLPAEAPIDKTQNRQGGPVAATGSAVDVWDDVDQSVIDHTSQGTRASDIAWHDRDLTYSSSLPSLFAAPFHELALRIAVRFDEAAAEAPDETWNLVGLDLDLFVELDSPTGSATLRLGASSPIPYPLPGVAVLSVPRTVRLPIDAFTAMDSSFDPSSITAITIRPAGGATGRIFIDEIEVAK